MAEIYANRSGRHAIKEVTALIELYKTSPQTVTYWSDVLYLLQKRFNKE